jgi:cystathionine gamma-lyase
MAAPHSDLSYSACGFGTKAIHAGQRADPITGAVVVPISLATTFVQTSPGVHTGFEYSRTGNPTRQAFEANIAALEKGKYGLAFASGSAATVTIINMLNSGDHVISIDDVYGGTNRYFQKVATPSNGISFSFVDFTVEGAFEKAITPKSKLVWLETPTNPTLKIADIKAISTIAKKHNLIVVVDNTFASPYLQTPLELGADIVVHSVTKYLGGHSDVVMGVLATSHETIYTRLKFLQNSIGAVPAPFDCYLALRGVKTLHLRMREHSKNAMSIATFLEGHPLVERVIYPGLPSHPQHTLASTQMRGFGGMITFFLKGGLPESRQFLENLHLFALAESLGAVESLAEHPVIMTHASVPPEQRKLLGISDNLIRLSVGVEDIEDLLADLKNALARVQTPK